MPVIIWCIGLMALPIVLVVGIIYILNIMFQRWLKTMSQKVCALLISPEKFQLSASNGSYNSDSPGVTGKKVSAILLPKNDSSSASSVTEQTGTTRDPWPFPSGATMEQKPVESGTPGEIPTNTATLCDLPEKDNPIPLSWWKI